MFRIGLPVPVRTVFLSTLICFGVPVLAGTEATPNGPSPAEIQKAAEQDPKICKRFKPTGSNIPKTYCFRRSTWDAMREESQQGLRDLNDRAAVNTGSTESRR